MTKTQSRLELCNQSVSERVRKLFLEPMEFLQNPNSLLLRQKRQSFSNDECAAVLRFFNNFLLKEKTQ